MPRKSRKMTRRKKQRRKVRRTRQRGGDADGFGSDMTVVARRENDDPDSVMTLVSKERFDKETDPLAPAPT